MNRQSQFADKAFYNMRSSAIKPDRSLVWKKLISVGFVVSMPLCSPADESITKTASESPVVEVRVEQASDREVIIEETAPIRRAKKKENAAALQERLAPTGSVIDRSERAAGKRDLSYVVEAKVFRDGITRVSWRSTSGDDPVKYSAFSNFDWTKMYGFQQVENQTHQFSFLLMVQNATPKDEVDFGNQLQSFQGALERNHRVRRLGFQFDQSGDGPLQRRDEADQFMQTVHRFINSNRRRIHLTVEARKRALREKKLQEIADRGKPKPPVRVRFSRVLPNKEDK